MTMAHDHEHGHGHGHITNARGYELGSAVALLGFRRRVFDGLVAASGVCRGDRVLDVGCGTGYLSKRVAAAGATVVGVDPSAPVLAYADHTAPAECRFVRAGAERLPFADGSFDAVVSSFAMHHVPPDVRGVAIAEFARVVRPGGRVFVVDARPPRGRLGRALLSWLVVHGMTESPVDEVARLLADAGLTVETADRRPLLRQVLAIRN
jgi:ubiquinone/menaquinone biosynthesis C-methylase UbiE